MALCMFAFVFTLRKLSSISGANGWTRAIGLLPESEMFCLVCRKLSWGGRYAVFIFRGEYCFREICIQERHAEYREHIVGRYDYHKRTSFLTIRRCQSWFLRMDWRGWCFRLGSAMSWHNGCWYLWLCPAAPEVHVVAGSHCHRETIATSDHLRKQSLDWLMKILYVVICSYYQVWHASIWHFLPKSPKFYQPYRVHLQCSLPEWVRSQVGCALCPVDHGCFDQTCTRDLNI